MPISKLEHLPSRNKRRWTRSNSKVLILRTIPTELLECSRVEQGERSREIKREGKGTREPWSGQALEVQQPRWYASVNNGLKPTFEPTRERPSSLLAGSSASLERRCLRRWPAATRPSLLGKAAVREADWAARTPNCFRDYSHPPDCLQRRRSWDDIKDRPSETCTRDMRRGRNSSARSGRRPTAPSTFRSYDDVPSGDPVSGTNASNVDSNTGRCD